MLVLYVFSLYNNVCMLRVLPSPDYAPPVDEQLFKEVVDMAGPSLVTHPSHPEIFDKATTLFTETTELLNASGSLGKVALCRLQIYSRTAGTNEPLGVTFHWHVDRTIMGLPEALVADQAPTAEVLAGDLELPDELFSPDSSQREVCSWLYFEDNALTLADSDLHIEQADPFVPMIQTDQTVHRSPHNKTLHPITRHLIIAGYAPQDSLHLDFGVTASR